MPQEQVYGGGGHNDGEADEFGGGSGAIHESVQEADDLLDEIDDMLESNAEMFVRSFIQKGGQ